MSIINVCCALIEDNSGTTAKIWTAQKPSSSHLAGLWEFPGGKIESGESGEQAIVREIREELGIEITVSAKLPPSVYDYGTHCIRLIPYICRQKDEKKTPRPIEHSALALLTLSRFDEIQLAPADKPVLEAYRARQTSSRRIPL